MPSSILKDSIHLPACTKVANPSKISCLTTRKGMELTCWYWHIEAKTRWPQFSRMTFWNECSRIKMYVFRLKLRWNLFLRVWLAIFQPCFRWWLGRRPGAPRDPHEIPVCNFSRPGIGVSYVIHLGKHANLVKFRNRKIRVKTSPIALKFDRNLDSSATQYGIYWCLTDITVTHISIHVWERCPRVCVLQYLILAVLVATFPDFQIIDWITLL